MSSHQHNIVSRVGWLDFSIVTTSRWSSHPLFFIEFGKIRSGFSEIFFFFTNPRIEMEISGGGGIYLFPSCLMLTSCLSLGRLFSFKLRSMLITRMEKFSSSDAIEKNKKKIKIKFLTIINHKFVVTWVIIIFFFYVHRWVLSDI